MPLGRSIVSVVAALAAATGGGATNSGDAGSFVKGLYAAYGRGEPDYLGRRAADVFSPALLKLVREDEASTQPGDVGVLDGDPICGCQDAGGLRLQSLSLSRSKANSTVAAVELRFGHERQALKLILIHGEVGWRIADIYDESGSLAALLRRGLAAESRAGRK